MHIQLSYNVPVRFRHQCKTFWWPMKKKCKPTLISYSTDIVQTIRATRAKLFLKWLLRKSWVLHEFPRTVITNYHPVGGLFSPCSGQSSELKMLVKIIPRGDLRQSPPEVCLPASAGCVQLLTFLSSHWRHLKLYLHHLTLLSVGLCLPRHVTLTFSL